MSVVEYSDSAIDTVSIRVNSNNNTSTRNITVKVFGYNQTGELVYTHSTKQNKVRTPIIVKLALGNTNFETFKIGVYEE